MYTEALEQMSIMQSEGKTEETKVRLLPSRHGSNDMQIFKRLLLLNLRLNVCGRNIYACLTPTSALPTLPVRLSRNM